jgi:HlyD family secretion protein
MKKRVLIISLVAVLLIAGGVLIWQLTQRHDKTGPLMLHGNVDIRTAELAFDGQALLATMRVEEGSHVKKGDVLATLDASRLTAELKQQKARIQTQQAVLDRFEAGSRPEEILQAKARLASAQARLANAKQTLDRLTHTAASGASSQQSLDDAQAQFRVEEAAVEEATQSLALVVQGPREQDIDQAKAQLKATQAQLGVLEDQLGDTQLIAPADGVIRSRLVEPGEYMTPGRAVYSLALMDPKWIRAYVPEPDLGRVRLGAKAWVTSDSYPGRQFDGWVGFISPIAEFTPKTVETSDLRTQLVYEVRVYVKDHENQLRLGMPAVVRVDETSQPSASPASPPPPDTQP